MKRLLLAAILCLATPALASEYHGQVTFNGLPVPGATVTATQGDKKAVAIADSQGLYTFADLADGAWTITVELSCFTPLKEEITIAPNLPLAKLELKMLPLDQIMAIATSPKPEQTKTLVARAVVGAKPAAAAAKPGEAAPPPDAPKPQDDSQRPSDGFLINGSSNNAATSQFTLAPAFGNTRSSKNLYNGSLALIFDNSALDARPYSITGFQTPKAYYDRLTGAFTFGGPLNIPRYLRRGPNFFLAYQWTRNSNDTTVSGLVPTAAERSGDLSGLVNAQGQPIPVFNPATGLQYAGNLVPVSPQAQALLKLYPLPNLAGSARYNYQTAVLGDTHQDALQTRLDKTLGRKNQLYGNFAIQSTRNSDGSLFGFVDTTDILGLNTNVNWVRRFNRQIYQTTTFRFSRQRTHEISNFEGRQNVSGQSGINGNLQDAADYGPPTLNFSSITGLSDADSAFNRNRTTGVGYSLAWNRTHHNVTAGGDFRRQEYNVFSQQDPRGTFTFTGAVTAGSSTSSTTTSGSDLADFLIGSPDASSIAFGNPDKYLRQSVYDAYITDDWRVRPELTINAGMRWEYGAPITETKNRLVNLDTPANFSAVSPVLASSPKGSLTGQQYPSSLLRPDRLGFEPRIGLSWRPIPGSTLVVKAGYGVYDDTSVYQATALALAQQAPLSTSLSISNSTCPISLANGFVPCAATTADLFAVDPNFRVGYAQTWQLSAQRDLPGALVATATYLGIKGTRGVQEFLPNTYPIGGVNPCPSCPRGFVYRTSGGDSTREQGMFQLRRRLRNGFTASATYTYSKSIDDDSVLGGQGPVAAGATSQSTTSAHIAQNWLNLRGERGLSSFDQRNLLNVTLQYTSGQGLHGGALMSGWRGRLLKEWTALGTIAVGSGLPETPIYLAAVPGTGVTGSIRPSVTGASIYSSPAGLHLNPGAYAAPATGQWGNAGRDSITGPGQFTFNASLARTFRLKDHYSMDLRVDSTNFLNHVTFTGWNTIVNGSTFGLPAAANDMRRLQTTVRVRY